MRSSGAVGSLRARGCLHTGVTRSQTFTRNDAGDRMRPLSRSRSPFRAWCVSGVDGESAAVDIDEAEALAWPQPR